MRRSRTLKVYTTGIAAAAMAVLAALALAAAGDDARYSKPLSWKKAPFSRVLALGYTDLGANGRGGAEVKAVVSSGA
jgi:hypothetical protein